MPLVAWKFCLADAAAKLEDCKKNSQLGHTEKEGLLDFLHHRHEAGVSSPTYLQYLDSHFQLKRSYAGDAPRHDQRHLLGLMQEARSEKEIFYTLQIIRVQVLSAYSFGVDFSDSLILSLISAILRCNPHYTVCTAVESSFFVGLIGDRERYTLNPSRSVLIWLMRQSESATGKLNFFSLLEDFDYSPTQDREAVAELLKIIKEPADLPGHIELFREISNVCSTLGVEVPKEQSDILARHSPV